MNARPLNANAASRSRSRAPLRCARSAFTLIEMLTTVAILIIVLGLMVSLARYVRDRSANVLTRELLQRLDDVTHEYVARTGHAPDVPAILAPEDLLGSEAAVRAAARKNNALFVELMKGELARVELKDFGPNDPNVIPPGGNAPNGSAAETDATHPAANSGTASATSSAANKPADATSGALHRSALGDLPISLYNGHMLADAWGNPIVFMADQHPAIGMAPLKGYSSTASVAPDPNSTGAAPATRSTAVTDRERAFFFFSAGPDGQYLTREDNLYSYEGRK